MPIMKILSKNPEETIRLGKKLGKMIVAGAMHQTVHGGQVLALYGDLGGGKTQFTKGIALGLGISDNIVSPTFTIRREYSGKKLNLLHYDFYRFEKPDQELVENLDEGISPENVTVIEWAERVEKYFPKDTIKINFKYISEGVREIEIEDNNLEAILSAVIPTDYT